MDLPARCDHVHAVAEQLGIELIEKILAVAAVLLPLEHLAQPVHLGFEIRLPLSAAGFVAPVGGDAVLGVCVHLVGADLHLERPPGRSDDRRVQGLIAVRFRMGDVVVELFGDMRPQPVHDTERRVAVADLVDQHAHGAQVEDLIEAQLLVAHLFPDAVDVLRASADTGIDAGIGERLR